MFLQWSALRNNHQWQILDHKVNWDYLAGGFTFQLNNTCLFPQPQTWTETVSTSMNITQICPVIEIWDTDIFTANLQSSKARKQISAAAWFQNYICMALWFTFKLRGFYNFGSISYLSLSVWEVIDISASLLMFLLIRGYYVCNGYLQLVFKHWIYQHISDI